MNEPLLPSNPLPPRRRRRLPLPGTLLQWFPAISMALVLIVGLVIYFISPGPVPVSTPNSKTATNPGTPPADATLASGDSITPHLIKPNPRTAGFALAEQLNAPSGNGTQDVQTLHALLRAYLRLLHSRQGFPVGNDSDLARVLTGKNPMKLVILPPNHPAISSDGRLRDRWGTPYFIHPKGNNAFDIRSAGPDRKMFTEDDCVADPAAAGDGE